jgi:hypothetical protein
VACGLVLVGCAAGSPFVRPSVSSKQSIVNEATGQKYTDCRKAVAEATTDTILTFSEGSFRCGAELVLSPEWIVLRGAGMEKTFLDATEPNAKVPGDLTALRVSRSVRVQDLTFGGLTDLDSKDARAELLRVGLATNRAAIVGGPAAKMEGSAVIVHSLISGWMTVAGPQPKPIALNGNEKVALIECVITDVEQEFERYPAPGSIVLLSKGVEGPFAKHEPAAKSRRDPSKRANVACGNAKNPVTLCDAQGQKPSGADAISAAARSMQSGDGIEKIALALRRAGKGFGDRFKSLGGGIRQPEAYWFDDRSAKGVEAESALSGAESMKLIAQSRQDVLLERCAKTDRPIQTILDNVATMDRLTKNQSTEMCQQKLKAQVDGLVAECGRTWDWEKVLANVTNTDAALGLKGEAAKSCRAKFAERLPAVSLRGPLADVYVRAVADALQLKVEAAGRDSQLSMKAIVSQLPNVVTKSDRPSFDGAGADTLDRIITAAQAPGAGDGRKLVETTEPCKLPNGNASVRATTQFALGDLPARARSSDTPRTVLELPVEATKDELGGAVGSWNVALVRRCDEKAAATYRAGVRKYVVQELTRLAQEGDEKSRLDAEVVLQMIRVEKPAEVTLRSRALPTFPAVLTKLASGLSRDPIEVAPVAASTRRIEVEQAETVLPPPPDWSTEDLIRAADVLAGATVASVAACKSLLPDVPWQTDGAGVSGSIVFESVSLTARCLASGNNYELSLVTPAKKVAPKIVTNLQTALTDRLGTSKAEKRADGASLVWPGEGQTRRGVLLKQPNKAGQVVTSIVVPIGSQWTK